MYFTLFIPWAEICGELEEGRWYEDHDAVHQDGSKASCKTRFSIDRTHQILRRKHRYQLKSAKGGEVLKHEPEQSLRWYSYTEMNTLLKLTGWKVENCIFDFDPEGDSENAHLLTFEVVKN